MNATVDAHSPSRLSASAVRAPTLSVSAPATGAHSTWHTSLAEKSQARRMSIATAPDCGMAPSMSDGSTGTSISSSSTSLKSARPTVATVSCWLRGTESRWSRGDGGESNGFGVSRALQVETARKRTSRSEVAGAIASARVSRRRTTRRGRWNTLTCCMHAVLSVYGPIRGSAHRGSWRAARPTLAYTSQHDQPRVHRSPPRPRRQPQRAELPRPVRPHADDMLLEGGCATPPSLYFLESASPTSMSTRRRSEAPLSSLGSVRTVNVIQLPELRGKK